jgi:tetratricopeptide (TPR) repeat protein
VLEALIPHASRVGHPSAAWILVHPSAADPGTFDFFRALNLQIIVADTAELLEFAGAEVEAKTPQVGAVVSRETERLFPSVSVPAPGTVPARPIVDFFRGAAPMWCDIFSGALYRTSHYDRVQNSIHAAKHAVITGIPGSGKTTLLMQLAAHVDYDGHKLVFADLSEAQAELLARRLAGHRALVFIDDFTNDAQAFSKLSLHPNIRLVAADRDHSLSTVLHIVSTNSCTVLDVTELTDEDLQGCRLAIPESIRTRTYRRPEVTVGVRPSLLEFVQENTVGPTLLERIEHALRGLRGTSPQLAEMLLFVAYIHACRTPVSMDMALAYWRGSIRDYRQIYDLVHRVGALITEYEGDLADEPQDYFAARSIIAAESILDAADDGSLRRMLLRFHNNISPLRICHYNTFKRHAYANELFVRAFPSWQEGRGLYEKIYAKDPNPYVRQHEALFLSKRGQHIEAFKAIERALAESRGNWSIRNSHAIILFRANIGFASDQSARTELDRSMDILKECYYSDRRKAFHAMVFAELALKYWTAYCDSQALEYLQHAEQWLDEQRGVEPWIHQIPRLIGLIRRHLPQ